MESALTETLLGLHGPVCLARIPDSSLRTRVATFSLRGGTSQGRSRSPGSEFFPGPCLVLCHLLPYLPAFLRPLLLPSPSVAVPPTSPLSQPEPSSPRPLFSSL
ncbi:unnamed protein product [Rangifer tarandus platyrhynchus]|uniref:Uncharacterized protein n=1 Tax=Rangifer tarandus platyrhynchus TaxID=3082113 RepID=A0AC59Y213_RANTA